MNMEMCRVCLSTDKQMLPLDETFITNYNLLTNLNITLLDGMPQYSCQTCLDTVKCFIEFREKSIIAETTLREVINSDIKPETLAIELDKSTTINETEKLLAVKSENEDVKSENEDENYDIDGGLDNFDFSLSDYEKDDKNNIVKFEEDEDTYFTSLYNTNYIYISNEKPKNIRKIKNNKLKVKKSKLLKNGTNEVGNLLLGKNLYCGICPKEFEDKVALNNHLDSHKKDRQCNICRQRLNSLSQLLAHRMMHIPAKQSKCHICERKFKSWVYLEYHYRNMHIKEDDKKLFCNYCPSVCDTPKKFCSHVKVHSGIKYICDVCSKGFKSKSCLRSHIKSHNKDKAYVCDMCEFSCKYSGGLRDHKIRRHAPQKVYCKQCKRPFKTQLDHDNHKCTRKLTICPICGLQLNGNVRLSRHMVKHSDEQKYQCNRCPTKYKSRGALIAHLDRHDGNRTKQCEYCPAKFYTLTVLIKHRRIHTGEKPYVCKVCNKGFTGNNNLKVHMRVHGEYLIAKKNTEQEDLTKLIVTK